ncbi:hypothetical protein V3W47_05865 [Deinococcus sp. YIM 134068]|uniref:hypothetical protein n=1 Tax=Deinococcus lichenicola TaxID=3118910 RepID=UPI002F945609
MYEDVRRIGPLTATIPPLEVAAAERALGLTFPPGYREFLAELGLGTYCTVVMTFGPAMVMERVQRDRQVWANHYYWKNPEVLPQAELAYCVMTARTIEGDQIVLHSGRPESVYILPRQVLEIHELPGDYRRVLDWIASAGVLYKPIQERYFQSIPSGDTRATQGGEPGTG